MFDKFGKQPNIRKNAYYNQKKNNIFIIIKNKRCVYIYKYIYMTKKKLNNINILLTRYIFSTIIFKLPWR